jgi:hypothetical protein
MNLERVVEDREGGREESERAKGLAGEAWGGEAGLSGDETKEAVDDERTAARDWCWLVVSGAGRSAMAGEGGWASSVDVSSSAGGARSAGDWNGFLWSSAMARPCEKNNSHRFLCHAATCHIHLPPRPASSVTARCLSPNGDPITVPVDASVSPCSPLRCVGGLRHS